MTPITGHLRSGRWPLALGFILLLAIAGCARPPSAVSYMATPIPSREARIWFYRDMNPNESIATPLVRLNGTVVGVSQPGGAFYRDVPPGRYRISVDGYVSGVLQDRDVDVAPGAEVYAKVLPADNFIQGGGGGVSGGFHRDSYYVWLYPPEVARPAIANSYFAGTTTLTAAAAAR
jgi:hypothetical protein